MNIAASIDIRVQQNMFMKKQGNYYPKTKRISIYQKEVKFGRKIMV